ncbi:hypothetical protein ASF60_07755 [Methylobacterium sp. Leaf113]|uniref:hypothetical protein n=1 Tax=Methylobacterium sp. Leaf113 TaxID=1736259 RepID=UPI0006FC2BD0|nr:hypothetical protein ASF60_07755 [Methylobacterium sp. Leaf113]
MRKWIGRGPLGAFALGCLLMSDAASAACTPPEAPSTAMRPVKPTLPAKPPCLDAKGGCPGWEAYSYNDAIKAYNVEIAAFRPKLEAYIQALTNYVKASNEYAQCEVKIFQ